MAAPAPNAAAAAAAAEEEEEEEHVEDDGTGQIMVDETPDLITSSLAEMRGLLSKDKALRMDGDGNVDEVLLRFLRVMKFNVTKAAARYVAHWDAREEWGYGPAPLTYSALPDDVKKATSLGFLQVPFGVRDKTGRQIVLAYPGRMDWSIIEDDNSVKHLMWYVMDVALRDEETQKKGVLIINNMAGASRDSMNRNAIQGVLHSLQNLIPVRLGGIRLFNQPWFFSWIFPVVSMFMKAKLRERIRVLGTDYAALGEWCEPPSIPEQLGGQLAWDHEAWIKIAP
eukprot:CAMPEP_0119468070 /NCGR_PEP_ID=MMETSP1344-20130328/1988_1 /TAXON_ID=236787 /ORGANISM="Florenciella parvula, Strain CCMP2471" /LENGTH=282 /DNA_ID=CAMNT_0007500505 /DNA_START=196 /DNA_END=1044 /DNA_ORIENTATION=-